MIKSLPMTEFERRPLEWCEWKDIFLFDKFFDRSKSNRQTNLCDDALFRSDSEDFQDLTQQRSATCQIKMHVQTWTGQTQLLTVRSINNSENRVKNDHKSAWMYPPLGGGMLLIASDTVQNLIHIWATRCKHLSEHVIRRKNCAACCDHGVLDSFQLAFVETRCSPNSGLFGYSATSPIKRSLPLNETEFGVVRFP